MTASHNKTSDNISNILFTEQQVNRVISKLKLNSAGGPDDVPPIFFKSCRSNRCCSISVFITIVFFGSACLPRVWSRAYITLIFKKGDLSKACNYRPISLTCTMCKLMEAIVKDHVIKYLLSKGLLSKEQHAFIARHSTITNLLAGTHD